MPDEDFANLLRPPRSRRDGTTRARRVVVLAILILAVAVAGLAVLLGRDGGSASDESPQSTPTSLLEETSPAEGAEADSTVLTADAEVTPPSSALSEASPDARLHAQAAIDADHGVFVLFGGQPGLGPLSEGTWLYDLEVGDWDLVEGAANEPSLRVGHGMADVDTLDGVFLYGGGTVGYRACSISYCPAGLLADTWLFDAATASWTSLDPAGGPGPRYGHAVAYDSQSDRVVLFGGVGSVAPNEPVFLDDTWAFDPATNTWQEIETEVAPAARAFAQLTYDAGTGRIYLFGGMAGRSNADAEMWAFDVDTGEWELINAGTGPTPRWMHQMDLDVSSGNLYVYGGHMRTRSEATGEVTLVVEYSDEAWFFDPIACSWQEAPTLPWQVLAHTSDSTSDGLIAWLGDGLYRYDGATGSWAIVDESE